MNIKWSHAVVFFLLGVFAANKVGFLAPISGAGK